MVWWNSDAVQRRREAGDGTWDFQGYACMWNIGSTADGRNEVVAVPSALRREMSWSFLFIAQSSRQEPLG